MGEKNRNPLARLKELFDPYNERTMAEVGGGKVVFDAGKIIENLRERMDRFAIDPLVETSVANFIDDDEIELMLQMNQMPALIRATAAEAATLIHRELPAAAAGLPVPPEFDLPGNTGISVTEAQEERAKAIFNEAIAGPDAAQSLHTHTDDELAQLGTVDQMSVFVAVLGLYLVKISYAAQQRRRDEQADEEPLPFGSPSYDPATGTFKIGETDQGDMVWQLVEPGKKSVHGLIAGGRSFGKTNMCRLIAAEAVGAGRFDVLVAEAAGRGGLADVFRDRVAGVASDSGETIELLEQARWWIDDRSGRPFADPTPADRGLVVIIDDAHAVLADPEVAAIAEHLTRNGGQVGASLIVASRSIDPADYGHNTALIGQLSVDIAALDNLDNQRLLRRIWAEHGLR